MATDNSTLLAAIDILTSEKLNGIVDMVAYRKSPDIYSVANSKGSVDFIRCDGRYSVIDKEGINPVAIQDPLAYCDLKSQKENLYFENALNSYPFAYEHIAQLWDHSQAPDICVIHGPAHNWQERGGHRGEHGSLDVIQSRAPIIFSGCGVRPLGFVDSYCKLVDLAPTILKALGIPPKDDGRYFNIEDGKILDEILTTESPKTVLGFLLDGTNSAVIYDLIRKKKLENIAKLAENGTVFNYGGFACLPSVTLPNHTSIQTGAYPGHHGVLHNAWYDKITKSQIITESPATWHISMNWLKESIKTIHEVIKEHDKNALCVSVNEMADRGADYSTFELWRQKRAAELFPKTDKMPKFSSKDFYEYSNTFKLGSLADEMARTQAVSILNGEFLGTTFTRPTYMWVNFTLTDAAFHEGGPYSDIAEASLLDCDKRIGEILDSLDRRGFLNDTLILLVADHGMEENNPEVKGDWDQELEKAGIAFRDEAYGFIYLDS
jgi:phosphonoacetate hydrolase